MAMLYREPNMVKWVGVRPGHNGTQIAKYAAVVNATAIVHTVTAGKTLFLCTATLGMSVASAGSGILFIRDGADVLTMLLAALQWSAGGGLHSGPFTAYPPIEIPSGYDIVVESTAAVLTVVGSIFGWEE